MEQVDQLRCDFLISVPESRQSEIEVLATNWITRGIPREFRPQVEGLRRKLERDCRRLSRTNPALQEMPRIEFDMETKNYSVTPHAGTCRNFADALIIAFSLKRGKETAIVVVAGGISLIVENYNE